MLARKSIALVLIALAIYIGCGKKKQLVTAPEEEVIYFIDSTYPADGSINAPVRTIIEVTFCRPMDTSTMTGRRFHFEGNGTYAFSRDSMKARIIPAHDLEFQKKYTVTISPGMADKLGNVMDSSYEFSFITEEASNFVMGTFPVNGQIDVKLDAIITATFFREIDTNTFNDTTVSLHDDYGLVPVNLSYSDRVLSIEPLHSLNGLTTYSTTLTSAIADTAGNSFKADYQWSFTTEELDTIPPFIDYVYPGNGLTARKDDSIIIGFSEAVDPTSIDNSEFYVLNYNQVSIPGGISVLGEKVAFKSSAELEADSTYTAIFQGDVSDLEGNMTWVDTTWSFTVIEPVPFQIVFRYPNSGGKCIPLDPEIIVECNKVVDANSVTPDRIVLTGPGENKTSGTISVSGSRITFVPDMSLKSFTAYKVQISSGVKDIEGISLPYSTWTFITKTDNLFPLAIGNKWVYDVTTYILPWGMSSTSVDSIVIVGAALIDGCLIYFDQANRKYRFENDSLQTTFFVPSPLESYFHIFYNENCDNAGFSNVETDLGDLYCQYFEKLYYDIPFFRLTFYFCPNIGPVLLDQHEIPMTSDPYEHTIWRLKSYELH